MPLQGEDTGVSLRHAHGEGLLSGMNLLLDPDAHPVIGHRGACGLAPENTMQSFALALEQGADALEFDVRLTADGVPVVLHDPTLGRTCDRNEPVEALSAASLAEADAGYRFSGDGGATWPFRGRRIGIPRVVDVLEQFPETPLLIEVKEVRAARPLATLIRERGAAGRVVVASFLEEALRPFHEAPAIPTGASRQGILRLWLAAMTGFPAPRARYRAYAVPDRFRDRIHVPTARFISAARRAGCPVHVWTVNDPERAGYLWGKGAAGVITNFPAEIVGKRRALSLQSSAISR
jgi:glycerophosphoryl diester phosphodiesterase